MNPDRFLTDSGAWQCLACGACCHNPERQPELKGYATRPGGPCRYLAPDGSCRVYATRPLACRTRDRSGFGIETAGPDGTRAIVHPVELARRCASLADRYGMRGPHATPPGSGA